jgi:hypothetical protein
MKDDLNARGEFKTCGLWGPHLNRSLQPGVVRGVVSFTILRDSGLALQYSLHCGLMQLENREHYVSPRPFL